MEKLWWVPENVTPTQTCKTAHLGPAFGLVTVVTMRSSSRLPRSALLSAGPSCCALGCFQARGVWFSPPKAELVFCGPMRMLTLSSTLDPELAFSLLKGGWQLTLQL